MLIAVRLRLGAGQNLGESQAISLLGVGLNLEDFSDYSHTKLVSPSISPIQPTTEVHTLDFLTPGREIWCVMAS